jgi:hypothetical protein
VSITLLCFIGSISQLDDVIKDVNINVISPQYGSTISSDIDVFEVIYDCMLPSTLRIYDENKIKSLFNQEDLELCVQLVDGAMYKGGSYEDANYVCQPLADYCPQDKNSKTIAMKGLLPGERKMKFMIAKAVYSAKNSIDTFKKIKLNEFDLIFYVKDPHVDKVIDIFAYQAKDIRLNSQDRAALFDEAYRIGFWNKKRSGYINPSADSGIGSSYEATAWIRKGLEDALQSFNISSMIDIPCGDISWISLVKNGMENISYYGADISAVVIENNQRRIQRLIRLLDLQNKVNYMNQFFYQIYRLNNDSIDSIMTHSTLGEKSMKVKDMLKELSTEVPSDGNFFHLSHDDMEYFNDPYNRPLINMIQNSYHFETFQFDIISVNPQPASHPSYPSFNLFYPHIKTPIEMIFCRHLMFHLTQEENLKLLNLIEKSNMKYFMATTALLLEKNPTNFNLLQGHKINLMKAPYCMTDPIRIYLDNEGYSGSHDCYMGLWEIHSSRPLRRQSCE